MKKLIFTLLLLLASATSVTAQDWMEQTEAPWIEFYPNSDMFFNFDVIIRCDSESPDLVIYYRYSYGGEDFTDWMEYGPYVVLHFDWQGDYCFEAYAVEPGKLESEVVSYYFYNHFDLYRKYRINYDFMVDGIYYDIKTDSTVAVSMEEIELTSMIDALVPADYDGKPCKSYSGNVVIPPTVEYGGKTYKVTYINSEAFLQCELSSLEIPTTVTGIGGMAFYECAIPNLVLPESINWCGDITFAHCNNLTEVVLPDALTEVPYAMFFGCEGLAGVTMGNAVTSIGDMAFYSCPELASVNIPNSVTSIGKWAFGECYNLADVTIGNSVETIGNFAFMSCTRLTSVIIPNSVTTIGGWAFEGCSNLSSVTIGSGVTTIGHAPFNYCPSLTQVTCLATTPPTVETEYDAFSTFDTATLFVPNEALEDYKAHEVWGRFYRIVPFLGAGPGDINGDNNISITDVTVLINDLLSGSHSAYCDVNGDGEINITDVTILINMLLSGGIRGNLKKCAVVQSIDFFVGMSNEQMLKEGVTNIPYKCFSTREDAFKWLGVKDNE